MRYRLVTSMLFAMLPVMHLLAAPAPGPVAILEIEPPPKGWSLEKHCKTHIGYMNFPHGMMNQVACYPEVRKLPSVARFKDARPWLAGNLRIAEEDGGRRLRLTFRAGSREEQVTILNALLRVNLRTNERTIKVLEDGLPREEAGILDLEKRIKSEKDPKWVDRYQKELDDLRSVQIPKRRAEIARLKQITVIQWAK